MRRVGEFARQILPCEVQVLVHIQPPLGTVGHIVDSALIDDELARTALAGVVAQFAFRDKEIGHTGIIQELDEEKISCPQQEIKDNASIRVYAFRVGIPRLGIIQMHFFDPFPPGRQLLGKYANPWFYIACLWRVRNNVFK